MLSLRTSSGWSWSLTVTVGAGVDTYTNTATSAFESVAALVQWLNDTSSRPWGSGWSWTWQRQDSTAGALLVLRYNTGFMLNSGASAALGFVAGAYVNTATGTTAALGTWAPEPPLSVRYDLGNLAEGDASGNGSVRPGSIGLANLGFDIEGIGKAIDAARLSSVLAAATSPRVAWVYITWSGSWADVSLGEVRRTREDTTYRFSLEASRRRP
jgi:hypothetical protein